MRKPTEVQRKYLHLTEKQIQDIDKLYADAAQAGVFIPYRMDFTIDTDNGPNGQHHARDLLVQLGLDTGRRETLESRWKCRWSTSWNLSKGSKSTRKRSIWQCVCGYNHTARQELFENSAQNNQIQNKRKKVWDRRVPYDFTGCLAHLEIIEDVTLGVVIRIAGVKEHNETCIKMIMTRVPYIPLHPHVYEVALQQLRMGASLSAIHKTNDTYIARQAYRGICSWNPNTANVRYNMQRQDHVTLYRKFSRLNGIDLTRKSHQNIDDWLNEGSEFFQHQLKDSVFHYVPRTMENDRFELGIMTEQMKDAAWRYGHGKQLLFDGTFGVCTSRVLLFIVMGLNEDNKGIPLAFLVFSAKSGARATHASYDTAILRTMLQAWRKHMERDGNTFEPRVVITDNDTRERAALLSVWPNIILLLCKFHFRQSWTNHRTKVMGGAKKLDKRMDFNVKHVHDRLRVVEVNLIATISHADAIDIVDTELRYLTEKLALYPGCVKAAKAGSEHLKYLKDDWLAFDLWKSWSQRSRLIASTELGIPVEGVLTTTNILEGFNGILKRTHLREWKKAGRRLRVDTFIHFLAIRICPEIFKRLETEARFKSWIKIRFPELQILQKHDTMQTAGSAKRAHVVCAYWYDDNVRDREAAQIVKFHRILVYLTSPTRFTATCASSTADISDPNHPRYSLLIDQDGFSVCDCADFVKTGGACKHLRAMRMILSSWVSMRYIYPIFYPSSQVEAALLAEKRESAIQHVGEEQFEAEKTTSLDTLETLISIESQEDSVLDEDITEDDFGKENEENEDEEDNQVMEGVPTPYQSNANAIQVQLKNRFEHTVRDILPKLYGLQQIVGEMSDRQGSRSFAELQKVVAALHNLLGDEENTESRRGGWVSIEHTSTVGYVRALSLEPAQTRKETRTY